MSNDMLLKLLFMVSIWLCTYNIVMVRLLRHRQTKGAATDRLYLRPPRHISTLPYSVEHYIMT